MPERNANWRPVPQASKLSPEDRSFGRVSKPRCASFTAQPGWRREADQASPAEADTVALSRRRGSGSVVARAAFGATAPAPPEAEAFGAASRTRIGALTRRQPTEKQGADCENPERLDREASETFGRPTSTIHFLPVWSDADREMKSVPEHGTPQIDCFGAVNSAARRKESMWIPEFGRRENVRRRAPARRFLPRQLVSMALTKREASPTAQARKSPRFRRLRSFSDASPTLRW